MAKITGKEGLRFEGKARAFDTENDFVKAVETGSIKKGEKTVVILRYLGPKGGPGESTVCFRFFCSFLIFELLSGFLRSFVYFVLASLSVFVSSFRHVLRGAFCTIFVGFDLCFSADCTRAKGGHTSRQWPSYLLFMSCPAFSSIATTVFLFLCTRPSTVVLDSLPLSRLLPPPGGLNPHWWCASIGVMEKRLLRIYRLQGVSVSLISVSFNGFPVPIYGLSFLPFRHLPVGQ